MTRELHLDAPTQVRVQALKKQGLTIVEIATALIVKERTVYNYLSRSS